jgi:hypothetical protein
MPEAVWEAVTTVTQAAWAWQIHTIPHIPLLLGPS